MTTNRRRGQALKRGCMLCGVQKTYIVCMEQYISTYPTDGFSRCHVAPILGSVVLHVKTRGQSREKDRATLTLQAGL